MVNILVPFWSFSRLQREKIEAECDRASMVLRNSLVNRTENLLLEVFSSQLHRGHPADRENNVSDEHSTIEL